MKVHGRFKLFTTLAIIFFHVLAGIAVWQMFTIGFSRAAWLVVISIYFIRMIGITVGYHRLLAHASYRPRPLFAKIVLAFAAAALQGPGAWWSKVHIQHHARTDVPGDPHRPSEYQGGLIGFFWAHVGWLFYHSQVPAGYFEPPWTAEKKKLLEWQSRWYWVFALTGILLPALTGWRSLLLGAFGLVVGWNITWSVNSIGHVMGDHAIGWSGDTLESHRARNFPLQCLWNVLALISGGELRHADHHAFQGSARLGKRWYEFDPGWWVIWLAQRLNWVSEVKRPDLKTM